MRVPLRPLRRLVLQPSMSPPPVSFCHSQSSSSASIDRHFSNLAESCSSSNLAVSLNRLPASLRTFVPAPVQPVGCALSTRACYSCVSLQHRGVHVTHQRCFGLRSSRVNSNSPLYEQKCSCIVCTYDGYSRPWHHVSKGCSKYARNGGYATSERCFCHGNAENEPSTASQVELVKIDELERQDVETEVRKEHESKEGASANDSANAVALSASKEDVASETKVLKDSNVLKKTGALRSLAERRRGLFSRHSQGKIPDLLTVPGIGPRNMEKLVAKGIGGVAELKQLYLDKFHRDGKDKMIDYLQSSVGIIHRHHAISITTFIKDTVEKEMKSEEGPCIDATTKRRLTFCVEGNISVGKTTFLHRVTNEAIELRDMVEIVPEPVAKWQDVGPEHFNILDAFYAEPQRYAYTFQNYVFITRLMQEQESAGGLKPLRLMERSVFSDRMVFVRAVHEAKWMNEMEISIYDSWFNPVVSALPGLVPDGFIYLRASPDTCHKRLQRRKRAEEQNVTLDYLRGLHEKHEQWLFPSSSNNEGIFSVTRPSQLIEPLPPMLQDRVFYLQGEHVHSSLQKVPALILDCEANIDFSRDLEAKALYAKQVSEFFEYVKRSKEAEPRAEAGQKNLLSNGLLLPGPNGLFMPDTSMLKAQHLSPLDLRRQPSLWK